MRVKNIVCVVSIITAALVLFTSASPWEGAAAVAPGGELPAAGRFVATNSFPRNTVVDITNIETGKSTRVIVAGGLDSPGLLATISSEAAEIIGMRSGSVGRIRMTQPSDPIAYHRFTEGLSQGIPDYDSGEVITEETYRPAEQPARETAEPIRIGREEAPPPPLERPSSAETASAPSGYVLEPEWTGRRSARNIVDLPDNGGGTAVVMEETAEAVETIEEVPEEIADAAVEEAVPEEEIAYVAEEITEEETAPAAEIAEAAEEAEAVETVEIAQAAPEEEIIGEPAIEEIAESAPEEVIEAEEAVEVAEVTEPQAERPVRRYEELSWIMDEIPEPEAEEEEEIAEAEPEEEISEPEAVEIAEVEEAAEEVYPEPEIVEVAIEPQPVPEEPVIEEEADGFDWLAFDGDYEPEMEDVAGLFYEGDIYDDWEPEIAEAFPAENFEFESYEIYDWETEEIAEDKAPEEELFVFDFEYEEEVAVGEEEEPVIEEVTAADPIDFNIVSAEERPPANTIYGIDPSDIIPGITRAVEEEKIPLEAEMAMESFIDPINPIAAVNPAVESAHQAAVSAAEEPGFSIPRIYELRRGSYYVQVASYDMPEMVEDAVSNIDLSYQPVVYKDGDQFYRVLLGPLNQGESAAMLARFKSIGYKDAFVRMVR
jgi:hypothetical protein